MRLSPGERDVLRTCPLFHSLSEEATDAFVSFCRTKTVSAGIRIFGPTDRADRFFLILAGRIKVYELSPQGREQILHHYGPGRTFGEAAMWMGGQYPAFAESVTETRLLVIDRERALTAIRRDPELAAGIIAGLSRKLHEFERLIADLSLKDVVARLAGVLVEEADAAGADTFHLSQSKRQLAARIGTIAETLSRAFKKLEAVGCIAVRGPQVTIRDPEGLRELAQGA